MPIVGVEEHCTRGVVGRGTESDEEYKQDMKTCGEARGCNWLNLTHGINLKLSLRGSEVIRS